MIYCRREGEEIRNGLNFYPLRDKNSFGGCLRLGNRLWRARYSKLAKQWFFTYNKTDPNALKEWETKHGIKHK
jgi:hypothetical protein